MSKAAHTARQLRDPYKAPALPRDRNFRNFTSYFVLSRIRATAEFFDRKLAASGERQQACCRGTSVIVVVVGLFAEITWQAYQK